MVIGRVRYSAFHSLESRLVRQPEGGNLIFPSEKCRESAQDKEMTGHVRAK